MKKKIWRGNIEGNRYRNLSVEDKQKLRKYQKSIVK